MILILWWIWELKSYISLIAFNFSYVSKRKKISQIYHRKNISDLSESRGPTWSLTRFLEPYVLRLSVWFSSKRLGLTTCHTYLFLGLALDWVQWCWVWQLARPVHTWTQHLDGLKDVGSNSSQYLYIFGLSAWLSLRMLGLVTRQTYTCLGLAVGWAQECSSSDP